MGVDVRMYAVLPVERHLRAEGVRQVSSALTEGIGAEHFWLYEKSDSHALSLPADDDREYDLTPEPAEATQRIIVHVASRYYGPGYERGDWPIIAAIAYWLQHRLGAAVYYGGDSGGALELLTSQLTAHLWSHFVKHGHRPYVQGFDRDGALRLGCTFCRVPMARTGRGGMGAHPWALMSCGSCNKQLESRDNGLTWAPRKERDS